MLPGTLTDINIKNGTNEIQITDLFSDTALHIAWVSDGNGVIYPICDEIQLFSNLIVAFTFLNNAKQAIFQNDPVIVARRGT